MLFRNIPRMFFSLCWCSTGSQPSRQHVRENLSRLSKGCQHRTSHTARNTASATNPGHGLILVWYLPTPCIYSARKRNTTSQRKDKQEATVRGWAPKFGRAGQKEKLPPAIKHLPYEQQGTCISSQVLTPDTMDSCLWIMECCGITSV